MTYIRCLCLCSSLSLFPLNPDGINLVGAAIGNGVMDYLRQEPSYAEYAYAHGLIPLAAKKRFDRDWELCVAKVSNCSQQFIII